MKSLLKYLISVLFAMGILSATNVSAQEIYSFMFQKHPESPSITESGVTFRLKAPKARVVKVAVSWLQYNVETTEMSQNQDGIWEITLPLPSPDLYTYNFLVDNLLILDPANVFVQRDGTRYLSALIVGGGDADLYKESSTPGKLEQVWYHSAENDMMRRMCVYTPFGYDARKRSIKYPVLYLLHGGGGDEEAWSTLGHTCQILDNLIAAGKARPMIVVMPNGNPDQYASCTLGLEKNKNVKQYESPFDNYSSLVADVVPFIDEHYNTIRNRKGRAVAGLSMGGGQSFFIAMRNVDKFSSVGIFSSGLIGSDAIGGKPFEPETLFPGLFSAPDKYNHFDIYYLSCGEQDQRINGMMKYRDDLIKHGYKGVVWDQYPGDHEWKVWRRSLTSFVQKIFK